MDPPWGYDDERPKNDNEDRDPLYLIYTIGFLIEFRNAPGHLMAFN
jgi:hypothetical protein